LSGGLHAAAQGFEHGLSVDVDAVEIGGVDEGAQRGRLDGGKFYEATGGVIVGCLGASGGQAVGIEALLELLGEVAARI